MKYIVLRLNAVQTYARKKRPAFSADGYEFVSIPALVIGSLDLPSDATITADVLGHVGWTQAQAIAADILGCTLKRIDLEDGFSAEDASNEIWKARIGDPSHDAAIYILIPQRPERACVLYRACLYPARQSARIERQAAKFKASLDIDASASASARALYMECVEKATHDPDVMQWLLRPDGGACYAMQAFDRAQYVVEARERVWKIQNLKSESSEDARQNLKPESSEDARQNLKSESSEKGAA